MSQNPAKTFGLYPKKGTLRPGSDADMVLVDPGWPRTVPERNPHLAVGSSIFMGRQCLGGPVTVLRQGKSSANAAKSREPFPAASSPRAHPKGLTHHLPSLSGTRRNIGRGLLPLPNIRIYLFEKTE
ncbi:amidohydrolase family protein [Bilophila wadsworthia]|uniref:amidohydrolase family protein n=1 Tax=Bilophila wadsworthia TaxID=35833 RepID=UPI003AB1D90A